MTTEVGRRRSGLGRPKVISDRTGSGPARQSRASLEHRLVVRRVELCALAHLLRDRKFQQNLITGVIGLTALVRMAREHRIHLPTRLISWYREAGSA